MKRSLKTFLRNQIVIVEYGGELQEQGFLPDRDTPLDPPPLEVASSRLAVIDDAEEERQGSTRTRSIPGGMTPGI